MPLSILRTVRRPKPDHIALALEHIAEEVSTPGNVKTTVEEGSRHKTSGLGLPRLPRPGAPAAGMSRSLQVGRFNGKMTESGLKPPGRAASAQAVKPTRSIVNAMNTFRTSPISK
jgi:hypothetical protein